jgi:hypothetical protein
MSQVECRIQKIMNLEKTSITVGERIHLHCQSSEPFLEANPSLEIPQELQHHIKVFKKETLSDSSIQATVTSVIVGEHTLKGLKLGEQDITPFSLHVESVQDPQNPVKQPYGPMVIEPSLPWMFLLLLGGACLLGFSFFLVPWVKKNRQKNLMAQFLVQCQTELPPLEEFFKTIRQIKKNPELWNQSLMDQESQKVTELYGEYSKAMEKLLGRIFQWPLTEVGEAKQKIYIEELSKKNHPLGQEILNLWLEIKRQKTESIKGQDLSYLIEWSLKIAPELSILKRLHG